MKCEHDESAGREPAHPGNALSACGGDQIGDGAQSVGAVGGVVAESLDAQQARRPPGSRSYCWRMNGVRGTVTANTTISTPKPK